MLHNNYKSRFKINITQNIKVLSIFSFIKQITFDLITKY